LEKSEWKLTPMQETGAAEGIVLVKARVAAKAALVVAWAAGEANVAVISQVQVLVGTVCVPSVVIKNHT